MRAPGYRTRSMLAVPLKNHQSDVVGVLQLLNAIDPQNGQVVPFTPDVQEITEAFAGQAAVAIENQQLIVSQKALLDSFMQVLAHAIDRKSPYTGTHCIRVPVIMEMLTKAACEDKGVFTDFNLNQAQWEEVMTAAWLHDCGKVATPEYVIDKATKLETIRDGIHTVRVRFALMKCEAELRHARACLDPNVDMAKIDGELATKLSNLDDDLAFIEKTNIGGEFLSDEAIARVARIASNYHWTDSLGVTQPSLSDEEVNNLSVRRGTLTDAERKIINDHVVITIEMLNSLPFPKHLRRVPEYAAAHHERCDGKGYPYGLTREQMAIPSRIMAIADVFEALTADDRPYKKAKKLSEALHIMSSMAREGHLDPDLFALFMQAGVWHDYAEKYLPAYQVDDVDVESCLSDAWRRSA